MPRGKKNPAGNDSISAMRGTGLSVVSMERCHGVFHALGNSSTARQWERPTAGALSFSPLSLATMHV